MSLSEGLLAEMEHEMKGTRKALERVDDTRLAWAPHEKSMTLGRLATHLAELPKWVRAAIDQDSLTLDGSYTPLTLENREAILELFDGRWADARAALQGVSDETLLRPWKLIVGDRTVLELPKIAVLRGMVLNHSIHHRGQLTVYLRMTGAPVPGLYGPSADEPRM